MQDNQVIEVMSPAGIAATLEITKVGSMFRGSIRFDPAAGKNSFTKLTARDVVCEAMMRITTYFETLEPMTGGDIDSVRVFPCRWVSRAEIEAIFDSSDIIDA